MNSRHIERTVKGHATSDGDGVKLTRVLTQDLQIRLDPFLMLDAFATDDAQDYIGGFPNHPHRGFETITYMIHGRLRHQDNAGHEGVLLPGSVQWMTAGKGIIHSEMPEQENGRMEGFQLWLNLPAKNKMCSPKYQDFHEQDIPVHEDDELRVKVICGAYQQTQGAIDTAQTQAQFYDLDFSEQSQGKGIEIDLPRELNAFIYVYRGELEVGSANQTQVLTKSHMAILSNDHDAVLLKPNGPCKAILIAGKPLHEPIAQYGPFVMNTQQELMQAVNDFRAGLF